MHDLLEFIDYLDMVRRLNLDLADEQIEFDWQEFVIDYWNHYRRQELH